MEKIPVAILTYKRPYLLRQTLESFFDLNYKFLNNFLFIALVQEEDQETAQVFEDHKKRFHHITHLSKNLGCGGGTTILMEDVAKLKLPYVLYLQDDWESTESLFNYMSELLDVMKTFLDVGCIRLRNFQDKVWRYNYVTKKPIEYRMVRKHIAISNAHFTLTPILAKMSIIQKMLPIVRERVAMQNFEKLGLKSGQLWAKCFCHLGKGKRVLTKLPTGEIQWMK